MGITSYLNLTNALENRSKALRLYLILFIIPVSFGQSPTIEWENSLGGTGNEGAYSICQTADGGYIVAGYTTSTDGDVSNNNGSMDCWIIKLDPFGNMDWEKTYGGSGLDEGRSIQQTNDGGYIVAGASSSNDGDVSGNHGNDDVWVLKLDQYGDSMWTKSLGGSDYDMAQSIQQTTDGGYILAGMTDSNDGDVSGNNGNRDYWVVKLDQNGGVIWDKSFGGSDQDIARSIQQTTDGGYIVAGYTQSIDGDITTSYGAEDFWILKLDQNGNLNWQKSLGGSSSDLATSIVQSPDGGYVVAGNTLSSDGDIGFLHGSSDYWVVKLNPTGNIDWERTYGGTWHEWAISIDIANDSGYLVTGHSISNNDDVTGNHGSDDFWVLKLDPNGNLNWQKSLGGSNSEWAFSVKSTVDNGCIVGGFSKSNDDDVTGNHGGSDIWIVKLGPYMGLSEIQYGSNSKKKISSISDSMGRKIMATENTMMIYTYSDGSTERVFVVD